MDFSPIYNSIYTVEQSRELIKVLDMCMNESYKKGDEKKQVKEVIPHHLFPLLKPLFDESGWKEAFVKLRANIVKMHVITLYTPYLVSEKTTELLTVKVREIISQNILVSIIQKKSESALSIEWKGKYGEF